MDGVKTKEEISIIQKAAEASSAAIAYAATRIREGISEIQLAREIEDYALSLEGATELAFETIVAAGESGAEPHHVPAARRLKKGDLVTIDFGVKVEGYCGDITRTWMLGEPTEKQREVYETVLGAQRAAIAAARIGMTCKELDTVARSYIEERGYGEYFIHTTGHCMGKEVHEKPSISQKDESILKEDMIFTIEPGIYIENWGGVRIEDDIHLTKEGARVITNYPTDFQII
jgi:Xaa-Pro dipeptidase